MIQSPSTSSTKPQTAVLPRPSAPPETIRDLRIARALRLRRTAIHDEMNSCLRQREDAYRLADALLDEFDELARRDKGLRSALTQVELRLQRAQSYFVSDDQVATLLNEIAEVGADCRRFCTYLGVEAIAKIPAHQFEEAQAALGAKRRRAAA
jgi:hypothetical protein